jgi:hypothetical protein
MRNLLSTLEMKEKNLVRELILSLVLLIVCFVINYYAGTYATTHESNSVTDIILSNIRVYDVDGVFIYGSIIFWAGVAILFLRDLRLAPFILRSVSLFIVIRSFFITLTHIGPFPERITLTSNFIINKLTFGGDLFFSGHTGLPFLIALIFWKNKPLRYIFLAVSVIFAVSVILGHLHYSIDVFAAYFITYSIFHIAEFIFPVDQALFFKSPIGKGRMT